MDLRDQTIVLACFACGVVLRGVCTAQKVQSKQSKNDWQARDFMSVFIDAGKMVHVKSHRQKLCDRKGTVFPVCELASITIGHARETLQPQRCGVRVVPQGKCRRRRCSQDGTHEDCLTVQITP